jgi:hypothetical protein
VLATNHAFSGSIIGALLPLPVAIPAAFASHFLLDMLPHYGIDHNNRNSNSVYRLIVFSDTFIALSYAVAAAFLHKWSMEITGWIAWSPDLVWVIYFFVTGGNLHIKPKNRFMRFHMDIQRYERPWGIAVDLVFAAVLIPTGLHFLLR